MVIPPPHLGSYQIICEGDKTHVLRERNFYCVRIFLRLKYTYERKLTPINIKRFPYRFHSISSCRFLFQPKLYPFLLAATALRSISHLQNCWLLHKRISINKIIYWVLYMKRFCMYEGGTTIRFYIITNVHLIIFGSFDHSEGDCTWFRS